MDEFILLLMSYLSTLFFSLFLICSIAIPLKSFADGQPVINEVLVHPSSGKKEWVELYVPDGASVNDYWIDDDADFINDSGSSVKKQITSVTQGSDSNHVVFELSSSMFNNDGDTVALFSPDGTLLDQYTYTKDPGVDVSIGRTPDETGNFQILSSVTEGSPNSSPQPTNTPTPSPTEKPAPTPKPTVTPKPTATPTPIKTKSTSSSLTTSTTSIGTNTILADDITSTIKNQSVPPIKTSSTSADPTSVLGMSTKSAEKKVQKQPQKKVLVNGVASSLPQVIVIILGGAAFIACGIVIYFKKIKD